VCRWCLRRLGESLCLADMSGTCVEGIRIGSGICGRGEGFWKRCWGVEEKWEFGAYWWFEFMAPRPTTGTFGFEPFFFVRFLADMLARRTFAIEQGVGLSQRLAEFLWGRRSCISVDGEDNYDSTYRIMQIIVSQIALKSEVSRSKGLDHMINFNCESFGVRYPEVLLGRLIANKV